MSSQEATDDNVQSMRDQGIADACAGYPAFAWQAMRDLFVSGPLGLPVRVSGEQARREAFAYARAYEANK